MLLIGDDIHNATGVVFSGQRMMPYGSLLLPRSKCLIMYSLQFSSSTVVFDAEMKGLSHAFGAAVRFSAIFNFVHFVITHAINFPCTHACQQQTNMSRMQL